MASVNNDALAEVLVALALLWLIRYLNTENVPVWQLGLIVGRSAADEDHHHLSGAAFRWGSGSSGGATADSTQGSPPLNRAIALSPG